MSPHYSRLPCDMTTEQQDLGRQHGLPEPHAITGLPGETAAFWLPGKQSCLVCGVEGFQTFTSACLALLLIMIHWWVPLLCTEPRSNLPFHYLLLFQNKKVKVWTWNACASHEAIEKAREWGPRLAFLLLFQQTFQVRLMLLVTAQAAWVTQFSDPFLLPLHLPVPTVFMVFPICLWEICFSFYLGRLSSAQWVPGRHLGAETWNLSASGWAAMGSMTHGDSMHSWAAFIGDQWLGHCRCPTSGWAIAGAPHLSVLILAHLHVALASSEASLHRVNRKRMAFFIIVGFLCWISIYIFLVEIPKLKIERCQLAPL